MQTMSGPSGIAAKDVFKAPNSNYQTIIYNNNNKWGTLNLKTQENIAKYKTTLIHNKTILLYLCFAFIPTNPEINA